MPLFRSVPRHQLNPEDLTIWFQHCNSHFWEWDPSDPHEDDGTFHTIYNQGIHICHGVDDNPWLLQPVYCLMLRDHAVRHEAFRDKGWPKLQVPFDLEEKDLLGVVNGNLDMNDFYEVKSYIRAVLRKVLPTLD